MQLIDTSFYHIDHDNNQVAKVMTASHNDHLNRYVQSLLRIVTETRSKRSFAFRSETTQVRAALDLMLDSSFEEGAKTNADRLLAVERSAQKNYAQITEIQKGVLFQASLMYESRPTIVVSKADHSDFLEENELSLRKGLPLRRQLFKAMAVSFNPEKTAETVFVMDSNRKIARYWWDTYLELEEKYTDSYNTKQALEYIERIILNPIKRKYPADHTILRNSTIGYFRSQSTFNVEDFANSISDYKPVNENLETEELKSKILSLPDRKDFDRRFSVDKTVIKKRMSSTIPLTESIDLVLKEDIRNLSKTIQAESDKEGRKYIKIRTDEGYERFKQ